MEHPYLRPLGFGEILDGAFTLYRRHFAVFAPTSAFITLVGMGGFSLFGGVPLGILATLSLMALYGALTRQAVQAYTGQPTSLADGLQAGVRAVPPLLGAAIVAGVGLAVAVFVSIFLAGIVAAVLASMGSVIAVAGVAAVVLAVLAVFAGVVSLLFAVLPAVVVEGAGAVRALERSFQLARGALPQVAGLMVVSVCITYLPMAAVLELTGGFAAALNPEASGGAQGVMRQLLGMVVNILTIPFLAAVMVVLYFDRRVRTEALDVQLMADRLAVAGD